MSIALTEKLACVTIDLIMRLGVHVSIAGHIYEAIDRASALGCNTFQIFPRNPRQIRPEDLDILDDVQEFRRARSQAGIKPVVVHIPYTVNLASALERLHRLSVQSYIDDINDVALLEAEYVVTHLGSFTESTEEAGLDKFTQGISKILGKTAETVEILLENTAGSGSQLGATLEHLQYVIKKNNSNKRLGMCLDTAHAFAAGFDIRDKKGLDYLLGKIDKLIGLDRLKVIHLNDSKVELGSRVDRHEHIGQGYIGKEGFREIINHKSLKDLPFILETPKKSDEDDLMDLKMVRSLKEK